MLRSKLIGLIAPFLLATASITVVYADQLSDAQNKQNQLQQQQKDTKNKIAQLQHQESSLHAQISSIETQIAALQKNIVSTQADLIRRDAQIATLKSEIVQTQKEIDAQYAVLQERIRVMYEDGTSSYLDVIFSSTSFSDMLDRLQMLSLIAAQDKQILQSIQDNKAKLDQSKTALDVQQKQEQAVYQSLSVKKRAQESAQSNEVSLLSQVHDNRLKQQAQLNSENSALSSLKSLISQLIAQEGQYSGGISGWTWPVPSSRLISSPYGWRTWSDGSREFHNGIDIAAPVGAPIVAATAGKVLYAGPATGFGDWIVIESNGGLIEIYGHMYDWEIKVSPGQIVAEGQPIAGVGSNGFSTGPHLHFTVAKGFDASGFPISMPPLNFVHP